MSQFAGKMVDTLKSSVTMVPDIAGVSVRMENRSRAVQFDTINQSANVKVINSFFSQPNQTLFAFLKNKLY